MSENYISCKAENGSINISEEVISAMVRTAVTEVEGCLLYTSDAADE